MRKFIVNVNGASYEVEVEEILGATAPASAPASEPKPASSTPAPAQAAAGQEIISAPMPGTILDVRVKPDDTVKKGQVLMVLEAMKMENEIMAPHNGRISAVNVAKGSTVNSGDALCILG